MNTGPGMPVLHDNYICMTSGDPTGKYGVALIVTAEVANRINNRMAHMTVNFGREKAIFMIQLWMLFNPSGGFDYCIPFNIDVRQQTTDQRGWLMTPFINSSTLNIYYEQRKNSQCYK